MQRSRRFCSTCSIMPPRCSGASVSSARPKAWAKCLLSMMPCSCSVSTMTMLAAASPATVSSSESNSLIGHLHARQVVGELPLQVHDAQRAALVGGAADLLAQRGELVDAVHAREAADVLPDVADRRQVARAQRLAHALQVAAAVGEEVVHQVLEDRLHVEADLVGHGIRLWLTQPGPAACAKAWRAARRRSPA